MEVWEHLEGLGADRVYRRLRPGRLQRRRPAPDRRRRAGRPPAPSRPDGPAGQHAVHPPALARAPPRLSLSRRARRRPDEDEAEDAERGHRAELDREAVAGAGLAEFAALARRRSGGRRGRRQTRPPTWAPTLIDPSAKVNTRLIRMSIPICPAIASSRRPRAMTKVAPRTPKIAPEAPALTVFGSKQQGDERARQERGEVEEDEARRPDRRLQQPAEDEQQVHVEADVDDADVDEAAR